MHCRNKRESELLREHDKERERDGNYACFCTLKLLATQLELFLDIWSMRYIFSPLCSTIAENKVNMFYVCVHALA